MKKIILLLLFVFFIDTFPQGHFQSFLNRINTIWSSSERQAVADSFFTFARTKGIPFIDNDTAVFLYRGSVNTVALAGDFNSWNANITLMQIQPTNFYYYRQKFEMNARLDYKFVVTTPSGTNWILDPENPHKVPGGYGLNSELAMPDYIQPSEIIYNAAIPHGVTEQKQFYSTNTGRYYDVTIYLPPGYNPIKHYPAVYFQDGTDYISLGSAINVLDNITNDKLINKVIGVFVKPNNRNEEYAGALRNQYAAFFAQELVPKIDSMYSTIKDNHMRLVMGDSYGGNISAIISYYYPDVFGNCGLHSGAFQEYNYEIYHLFINSPKKDVNFSSVWGTYEPLWDNMRSFRDSLLAKGYSFQWLELPEGHSWGQWRATTDRIIEYFYPYGLTEVAEHKYTPSDFTLEQNYPNPFNPSTSIRYSVPGNFSGKVQLKVFDITGKEIAVLVNDYRNPGVYEIRFNPAGIPSGVYFYRLTSENFTVTKKMLYLK